ncbi:MAG: nucleoside-diphosphate sugar epimerase/dehydratase [Synergistales bacterium]|nr:nucleoside-diphosphate sugar epimerase/dehydratase [Synergistales bacterium]MDY6400859.1 nucleoside-diphosphate sugar epimerase/dehydratase [Synergistales bacterium]MDY6404852.1 nucleoside-diphosphate sugar epimerase/dehydratase [Synergistales bacterium]MDY6410740.1 nucleoside-diphosphate sugar epimerase/dehydratase [Synergistales bacterium]MDY6414652.1 nucleoside-diphosphate sugar epimerase/dehydratase [Synergistales bacterium]
MKISSIQENWRRTAGKVFFVALIDFVLLAFAVYVGYALREGTLMPTGIEKWPYMMLILPAVCVAVFALFAQYGTIWPHAGTEDFIKFTGVYIFAFAVFLILNALLKIVVFSRISFAITFLAGLFFCGGLRFSWLLTKSIHTNNKSKRLKTLIIGASEAGAFLARDLMRNENELYPAGFVDDDPNKIGMHVSGLMVLGSTAELKSIVERENFKVVLIAFSTYNGKKIKDIYNTLAPLNVQVRILPSLRELAGGQVSVSRIRKVKLEDLLGREPVKINLEHSMNYIHGKRILITGAGGSIGSEIVHQVIYNTPSEIYVLGHGEQSIYLLLESLNKLNLDIPIYPIIADVADEVAMQELFEQFKPQVVFHAAAHKHVPLMELSPREAMRVNDLGTRTIARFAGKYNAERMVMISTDKAVNPSSVMGATKRLAEKILEHEQRNYPETKYMAVRFGNVLGSRGSVIPKFEEQIASGGPVTVTHPDMKRYFMLIPEAVSLVIQAGALGHGGEIFVLDMGEPVVIKEMAELLIHLCGYEPYKEINIVFTGIRQGEKLYEELFYDENSVHGTLHPKIFVSNIQSGETHINSELDTTLEYALKNPHEALNLLRKLVPEYN